VADGKSQANEDEAYMFLLSLLPFIKKLEDITRLVLRIEFLSSVTRRIQLKKNLSPPLIVFPQHVTVRILQLQLRVQQVSIPHIIGIQTLNAYITVSCTSSADLL
jgi:hypothetical protein